MSIVNKSVFILAINKFLLLYSIYIFIHLFCISVFLYSVELMCLHWLCGSSSYDWFPYTLLCSQDIVIGTPGRLKDLIEMGVCSLKEVSFTVSNIAQRNLFLNYYDQLGSAFTWFNHMSGLFLMVINVAGVSWTRIWV